MPAGRRYGMDHDHYSWSPIVNRNILKWPQDAKVAICVIVNLEYAEWSPPEGSYELPTNAGGIGRPRPFPDYARLSHREYGHRIGVFRVLDVLNRHGISPTIAMDAFTATNYPFLVRHCLNQGYEIIAHGMSVSRVITSRMSESEEREYISESIHTVATTTGTSPRGWLGPEYGESSRTPGLLAEAGIEYVCDWVNDEQPYKLTTPQGDLYSLPIFLELDTVFTLWERRFAADGYTKIAKDAFDRIYSESNNSSRLLTLNLHPWLIGQPHRIGFLDSALDYICSTPGVWSASGSEIISWYKGFTTGNF